MGASSQHRQGRINDRGAIPAPPDTQLHQPFLRGNAVLRKIKTLCLIVGLLAASQAATAGIIVGGTRVIYDSAKKEASVNVSNPEKTTPFLIQSRVENATAENSKPPFIITPPLFRLDAGKENALRIVRTGGQLSEDRESLYWLNIKSIPSTEKSSANQLQISMKTRIKLIYRPAALASHAAEAYKALTFTRQGSQLTVSNPTAYHLAFYSIKVGSAEIKEAGSVAPFSSIKLPLPAGAGSQVSWQTITDFGGIMPALSKAL
jgi:P pilus assembly chaperone PapD